MDQGGRGKGEGADCHEDGRTEEGGRGEDKAGVAAAQGLPQGGGQGDLGVHGGGGERDEDAIRCKGEAGKG